MKRKITMVLAMDAAGGLGCDGRLPWHYPEDMAWFRKNTLGKTVVMGSTTFFGLQYHYGMIEGFPERKNIVLTSRNGMEGKYGDVLFYNNVKDILDNNPEDLYIVGGLQTYMAFAPYAHEVLQSLIKDVYMCDTFLEAQHHVEIFKGKALTGVQKLSDNVIAATWTDVLWQEYLRKEKEQ